MYLMTKKLSLSIVNWEIFHRLNKTEEKTIHQLGEILKSEKMLALSKFKKSKSKKSEPR